MTQRQLLEMLTRQARRVLRGGSWYYDGRSCRSADRLSSSPANRDRDLGFRVTLIRRSRDTKTIV